MRSPKRWRFPGNWAIFRMDDRLLLMFIGTIVGTCSGLAALALNTGLNFMLKWVYHLSSQWWSFVLPAAGACMSSLFLEKIVKEGAGHGVPEVIYSVSRYGGLLRFRSGFSRIISSCLTIGSGGSAGPEAPVVMSGAAIGSNIARYFALNDRQRIILVGCGAAGAISSIFNAPIAGMVFAVEVILGEWSAVNIIPIAIASVAGAEISRALQGNRVIFSHQVFSIDIGDILASVGLAALAAFASILLTHWLRAMQKISHRAVHIFWLRAAVGGAAVGIIGLWMPVVLGEGYHRVVEMIGGNFSGGLLFVAVACLAKIFATSLTLGWGGSGGIFAPCLVIGSAVGLTYHRALTLLLPSVTWVNEGCFALLGMAGLISGMLQAPLTGIFLVVEITGGYGVILPLIIVSAISTTICYYIEPASYYLKDLVDRGHLLRPGTDARVLSDINIRELIEKDCITVSQSMLLRDFIKIVEISTRNFFPVEDEKTGHFAGMVHLDDIRPYLFNPMMYDAVLVGQIMNPNVETVSPEDDLTEVLKKMDSHRLFSMPVVINNRFVGMISKATLLDKYRKELMVQTSV